MVVRRATLIRKTMMTSYGIEMEDISNNLFDKTTSLSNMGYFNAQGLMLENRADEQAINCALHHEQVVGLGEPSPSCVK